jgi:hypothetical protein
MIGLCSRNARIGDIATVVRGCKSSLFFSLRRVAGRFEIIGDMYVYGFMERQAVET